MIIGFRNTIRSKEAFMKILALYLFQGDPALKSPQSLDGQGL